ncbi:zinc/manganese transport system ATP-binding protein [Sphaerotilus hippei]|uniref:Zinc/manganese transport system ATP-binding protein n=1 Tax=Sphaerotilus hippei TaxID=744406 RepID=A0A318H526_9BURK|nr:zinc ABC transporter ATP-binding protein AztA [Sphaerotilus hippei]PXW98841.1 zinc/manganese transport system ATP-binding protein [Sphaerotilus hippei]
MSAHPHHHVATHRLTHGEALALKNLTVAYRGHPAVHHLDGAFERGSMTAIVGPNGAGKSSLLGALTGELRPAEGEVTRAAGLRLAYLPQQSQIDRSFPVQVMDVVALGLWSQLGRWRGLDAAQREQVRAALAAVGLQGFERRLIGEISVGQFQRVLFARVLLQQADVILLDEPFNAIDARTTADLLGVVHRWHAEARTVIAVLHDLDQVRTHFERTLLLARRCVAWGPTAEVLRAEHLFAARQMSQTWDEAAPRCVEPA